MFQKPISTCFTIAKSDTTELPDNFIGFYVGGAGNVTIMTTTGQTVLFTAPPVGFILAIRARRIMSTGTTATALVGFLSQSGGA